MNPQSNSKLHPTTKYSTVQWFREAAFCSRLTHTLSKSTYCSSFSSAVLSLSQWAGEVKLNTPLQLRNHEEKHSWIQGSSQNKEDLKAVKFWPEEDRGYDKDDNASEGLKKVKGNLIEVKEIRTSTISMTTHSADEDHVIWSKASEQQLSGLRDEIVFVSCFFQGQEGQSVHASLTWCALLCWLCRAAGGASYLCCTFVMTFVSSHR